METTFADPVQYLTSRVIELEHRCAIRCRIIFLLPVQCFDGSQFSCVSLVHTQDTIVQHN